MLTRQQKTKKQHKGRHHRTLITAKMLNSNTSTRDRLVCENLFSSALFASKYIEVLLGTLPQFARHKTFLSRWLLPYSCLNCSSRHWCTPRCTTCRPPLLAEGDMDTSIRKAKAMFPSQLSPKVFLSRRQEAPHMLQLALEHSRSGCVQSYLYKLSPCIVLRPVQCLFLYTVATV